MRTTETDLSSGAVMATKRLTTLNSVPLMLEWNALVYRFWVYRFWASGKPIIYVCGDHMIAAKRPWRSPRYFKTRKPILRIEVETIFSLNQFVFEHNQTLITQRITFKGESRLIYMLGHLWGSPFKGRLYSSTGFYSTCLLIHQRIVLKTWGHAVYNWLYFQNRLCLGMYTFLQYFITN